MPEEGVPLLPKGDLLSFEEIERLAALFVRLGVRKIRLTGGEPLVRRGVDDLVARIGRLKAFGLQRLAMTSNALLLRQHLPALRAGGLDAVNLSLDTLRPDRFREITLRDGCEETIAAIRAAAGAGFDSVKVNAVVMAGVNDDELVDLARAFALAHPIEVRYIEYMPFEGNHWGERLRMFPAEAIRARLEEQLSLETVGLEETARIYRAREKDGRAFRGRIGIISSMTEPFCATCNRIRLTADGHFRWCLLDEGEIDLREPLRAGASDAELTQLIEDGLRAKKPGHAPAEELVALHQGAGHFGRWMTAISTPAREAFSDVAATAPASWSPASMRAGSGRSCFRAATVRCSHWRAENSGQRWKAKLRAMPGACRMAMSAASMAMVPDPQSGSQSGCSPVKPAPRRSAAASVSRKGAFACGPRQPRWCRRAPDESTLTVQTSRSNRARKSCASAGASSPAPCASGTGKRVRLSSAAWSRSATAPE